MNKILFLVICALANFSFAANSKPSGKQAPGYKPTTYSKFPAVKKGGNFVDAVMNNPSTLNPILITAVDDREIASWIFLPLFGTDEETYEPYPIMAEKVEVSKDKKEYVYTLNSKAKWSDGTPVTADDYEFTFNKLMDPKVDAAVQRSAFVGAKLEKIDATHIKFIMENPRFNTLEVFSEFVAIQKKQFEKETDFNKSRENLRPIGSGPYRLKSQSRDQNVILERVADWWGNDLPDFKARFNFDTITLKVIADPALRYETFLKGDLDATMLTSDQFAVQIKTVDADKVGTSPSSGKKIWAKAFTSDRPTSYFEALFNVKHPIFGSVKVRQAIAYLMDYKTIIDKGMLGLGDQALSSFGTNTNNTAPELRNPANQYKLDPKKAMELLKSDGWADTDGDNLLDKVIDGKKTAFRFQLKIPNGAPAQVRIAQIIKEQFKKVGIEVEIRPLDWSALGKDLSSHSFDLMLMGYGFGSMYPDARQQYHTESANGGSNGGSYSNPKVDQLIEESNHEFDRKKREKLLQEISRILYKELPCIMILERHAIYEGLSSKLKSPRWSFRYSTSIAKDFFYF